MLSYILETYLSLNNESTNKIVQIVIWTSGTPDNNPNPKFTAQTKKTLLSDTGTAKFSILELVKFTTYSEKCITITN